MRPARSTDVPIVSDETLPAIIEQEIARAIGNIGGDLSEARTQEFDYYYGRPFGNEVEGESQVVSTDVADTVESVLPAILRIFTSSDDVVRFDPTGPEDEEQAKQQTDAANYVFYRQNNGFLVLYEWFKDAMIQKNGIVKYWWDDKKDRAKESYQGLTDGEYAMLMKGEGYVEIEELSHEAYDDPAALQAREVMAQRVAQAPEQVRAQLLAALEAQPIPKLHDVQVRIVRDVSKICIETIPPEEFGISADHNHVTIQDTPFCYHRSRKTISYLREMGCPEEIIENLAPANEPDITPEAIARDRYIDMTWRDGQGPDQLDKIVWVTECFIRCDFDGDGIAELRHIIMPGRTIWINEECDHINFAAITPIIMPHRFVGRSLAELVMDIQFTKSTIWRQMLNNLYLTNNPRKAVLSSAGGIIQANLDDLLTSRPGGIMREYVTGAIRNEEIPFVAQASFPMLEYMDGIKENRTGSTRYNQGTDADSLNKTARGIQLIQTAGQQRLDLIARIFAETGVKDLMRGIVYMLSKYSSKAMTLKLRNKWVDIDPREWKTMFNMTVNVGLGTGNKDIQLAHLGAMGQKQMELIQTGRGYMVSDENIYNVYTKMAEAMGFKHPEMFVSDPQSVPPEKKQGPPPPELIKIQAEQQESQMKMQAAQQKATMDAQMQKMLAELNAQTQISITQMNNAAKKELEQMKIAADAQMAAFEKGNELRTGNAQVELNREEALARLNVEREIAQERARLAREEAETKASLAAWEAQEKARLEREIAVTQAETERMKLASAAKASRDKTSASQQSQSAQQTQAAQIDFLAGLKPLVEAMTAKKTISMTLPDGRTASAEVTPQ